jgi:hypothetical protein
MRRELSFEDLRRCTTLAQFAPRLARAQEQLAAMPERERYLMEAVRESERLVAELGREVVMLTALNRPVICASRRLAHAQHTLDRYRFSLTAVERAA